MSSPQVLNAVLSGRELEIFGMKKPPHLPSLTERGLLNPASLQMRPVPPLPSSSSPQTPQLHALRIVRVSSRTGRPCGACGRTCPATSPALSPFGLSGSNCSYGNCCDSARLRCSAGRADSLSRRSSWRCGGRNSTLHIEGVDHHASSKRRSGIIENAISITHEEIPGIVQDVWCADACKIQTVGTIRKGRSPAAARLNVGSGAQPDFRGPTRKIYSGYFTPG